MHYTQVYIIHELFIPFVYCFMNNNNKRAQRALGRSPEEKVKGQGEAIILI